MVRLDSAAGVGVALGAAVLYLSVHTVVGRQGLASYIELQDQERALIAERAGLIERRDALSADVARLDPRNPDLDLIDERARKLLFAAHPDEVLVEIAPLEGG
jgi:cell division protein FtsB